MDTCARCQWRFSTPSPAPPAPSVLGSRCPNCSRYAGLDATFCPHCGTAMRAGATGAASASRPASSPPPPPMPVYLQERPKSFLHQLLRLALTIWLVAYPLVSCGPVIAGAAAGGSSGAWSMLGGLVVGGFLWWPWIVGIIVLGLLAVLTR